MSDVTVQRQMDSMFFNFGSKNNRGIKFTGTITITCKEEKEMRGTPE